MANGGCNRRHHLLLWLSGIPLALKDAMAAQK